MATYYHNPRCSKSREGIRLLQEAGLDFKIKEYLLEDLSEEELQDIFEKLGRSPRELIRTSEKMFKEHEMESWELSDREWIAEILENPILLERPILVNGDRAAVGRPPEDLVKII